MEVLPATGSHDAGVQALPPPLPSPSSSSNRIENSTNVPGLDSSATAALHTAATNLQDSVWAGHDAEGGDNGGPELSLEDQEVWERLHAEEQEVAEYEVISVWDELAESFLREGMISAFLANKPIAKEMKYHAKEQAKHAPSVIRDVTDSENYCALLNKHVTIDGKSLAHKYFDDARDVALGLSTDGFAPFKCRTKTAWPLILFNYNLHPDIHTHLNNILGLGVIPGPKKPVDFNSFLWPVVHEFLQLSVGVHAYNALSNAFFALRVYLILIFGDIPAISIVMRMKGHNGVCPCHMCEIQGVRIPESRNPVHYVSLNRARHPHVLSDPEAVRMYDPSHLPLRTHSNFMKQTKEVQFASSESDSECLTKLYGIKGTPVLSALSSLSFPSSFPYDFMHLIWENVIKNLMLLWTGKYKDLDEGSENYQFPSAVWDAIGSATADSGDSLPYIFGPRPPNIATDKVSWTADTWSFWTQYIAPILLRSCFLHDKYYDHFVELVRLINICLGFDITTAQVDDVHSSFIKWVQKYEE
ncbi:hypothetical protein GSI_14953 [Ganoderma sinense ZZ0214-1]|uniref:Transposase family Tnp2 protein n=1 Tax=Ganoderma sinense ZZ0214-1 TaxID=1077348 RepID=A0A2G8RQ51_9APHY|nr:hypothetical protein GSI_14953 [Ganoderma sinense ZZ0214-1]